MNSLGPGFDTLLTRGALVALGVAGVWGAVVVGCVAVEARSGGRIRLAAWTGCPPALRGWLLGLFVVLFAGVAGPAVGSDTGSGAGPGVGTGAGAGVGDAGRAVVAALDGLPLPDRVTGGGTPAATLSGPEIVVVRPGDSLWSITRARLRRGTQDADVAEAVERLYAANRQVIGPDPDLIVPGQRLRVSPPTHRPTTSTPLSEER